MGDCEINGIPVGPLPSPELDDVAAAWLLSMNGPTRDENMERGFARWLKEDPMHAVAFREVSRDYQHIGDHKHDAYIAVGAKPRTEPSTATKKRRLVPPFAVAAALAAITVGGWLYFSGLDDVTTTGVGEQRSILLADGTKAYLNTSSRIVVQYDESRRQIRLDSGEVLFEVAKDIGRPFVVLVGDRRVTAIGTAFLVRQDAERLAVTLVEGKVSISSPQVAHEQGAAAVLSPGERLTFQARKSSSRLDHPPVQKLLAWQQGRVSIDDMRLVDAIAEMNRYSPVRIVVDDPAIEDLLITGAFIAGQSANFARAVAVTYGLNVVDEGSTISLSGPARSTAR